MDINSAIGIFDSGLGGLSVLKQFIRFLPNEKYIYLGDTARVPYGNKSKSTVIKYSEECSDFLLRQDVKLIVIACNTASSVAIDDVSKIAGNVPVVGMIRPGSNAALRATIKGKIGIIGTRATVTSNSYLDEINNLNMNQDIEIYSQACPLFVPLVEEGMISTPASKMIAIDYLEPFLKYDVDTLILGCTHYPLLSHLIQEILPKVNLIDSGEHASVSSLRLLAEKKLLKEESNKFINQPEIEFYVTDLPQNFQQQAHAFLGFDVNEPKLISLD